MLDCDVPILESFAESVCFLTIIDESQVDNCIISIGKLLWRRVNQKLGFHATTALQKGPYDPPIWLELYKWHSKPAVFTVNVSHGYCTIAVFCKTVCVGHQSTFKLDERFDRQNPMPLQQRFRPKDWFDFTEGRLEQLVKYFKEAA